MDLRQLRHFIAVAEELHFGRAALRLHMKQPPLSQSIQRLEASLGVILFERSPRHVILTSAGATLLPEAREMVAQAEGMVRRVRLAAEGERDRIKVGFLPWSLVRSIPLALRAFATRWPGVRTRLYERPSRQQVADLRAGNLDLGIISLNNADTTGLVTRVVEHSQLAAAIPAAWPLARRASLKLVELADAPFIIFPPHLSPSANEAIMTACRDAGFTPNVIQETAQPFTMLNMVANELGVALLQSTAAMMAIEGVAVIPLSDAPALKTEIALAWNPKELTPALAGLIEQLELATLKERNSRATA